MKKNTIMTMAGLAIAAAILILLMAATPASSGVELPLKELLENQEKHQDDFVTVEGLLIEDSIEWDADKIELKFDVQDEEGNTLHVVYNGVKPDNFSEGVIAILQGYLGEKDSFIAESVQTRCPSKYEGEDMENYDPEFHKEKLNEPSSEE
ncbi:cytochrome c maturation protein CcmE [Mesobacillus maritimus]|uniref:cytochrome c maturation protein CcmE n=1 Tax=Mesobacillus maritimus TaxID=1643336 RepID=UPI00384FEF99